jgi:ferredoxin
MSNKTKYEQNIEKIVAIHNAPHVFYTQVPETQRLYDFAKLRFNEEDAAICAHMSVTPVGESADVIAGRLNIEADELIPILDRLVYKGLVSRLLENGTSMYSIHSLEPGWLLTSFGKGEDTEKTRALAAVFDEYFTTGGMAQAYRSTKVPFFRTVPIEQQLDSATVVLPYERVSELLKNVNYFAVTHCQCKTIRKLVNDPCNHTSDTEHCMLFNDFGKIFVETGFAREITKAEAYDIVKRAEDAGLVHMTMNNKTEPNALCSCCPDCCLMFRSFLLFDDPEAMGTFARSDFLATVKNDACDGREVCIGKCPAKAISLSDGKASVDTDRCIGCGICGYACPKGAILLKRRPQDREIPEDFAHQVMATLGSRASS